MACIAGVINEVPDRQPCARAMSLSSCVYVGARRNEREAYRTAGRRMCQFLLGTGRGWGCEETLLLDTSAEALDDVQPRLLAEAGTQRRTSRQRAWAEPKTGAKWRRDSAQHVATAGTPAVFIDGTGCVATQPVTAKVTNRVDTLNGKAGKILHLRISSVARGQSNFIRA